MGDAAAGMIIDWLRAAPEPSGATMQSRKMQPELVVRESTRLLAPETRAEPT
jgi:DNA-binding LacI/PurR family transcriptional regulator